MNAFATISQYTKMLENLDAWLGKAVAFASARKFEPDVLVQQRLAPDQYPLARQVQSACDSAKFCAAYLSGQKAPAHPDTETTMSELRARIATCVTYLKSVSQADLAGASDRRISPPFLKGKWVHASEYVDQMSTPNFYFHLITAYAILRHSGVDVGKMDFIGPVPMHDG